MPESKDSQPAPAQGTRKRILIATYEVDLRALAEALVDYLDVEPDERDPTVH